MNKRIQILALLLCLLVVSCFYSEAKAYSGSQYTTNVDMAAKLDKLFSGEVAIFSNVSTKFNLGSRLDNSKKYYWANNSYSGKQCYAYAQAVYYYLTGDVPYHGSAGSHSQIASGVKCLSSLSYSSLVGAGVGCGAYIRTTPSSSGNYDGDHGHSMIILTYTSDSITVLHGNADGKGLITITNYSWSDFNKGQLSGRGRYVAHIIQPKVTAGTIGIGGITYIADIQATVKIRGDMGRTEFYLKDEPYAAANTKKVVKPGETYTTHAVYKNKYNNFWLQLTNGYFICANEVTLQTQTTAPTASGLVYPTGNIDAGKSFELKGTVSGSSTMTEVKTAVYKQSDTSSAVSSGTVNNVKTVNIYTSALNTNIKFKAMATGNYFYRLTAKYYTYKDVTETSDNPLTVRETCLVYDAPFTIGQPAPAYVDVTGISLNSQNETLMVGDTFRLTAEIKPSNASNKNVVWTSDDENIVTVDQSGNVTAVGPGGTWINAYAQDNMNFAAFCYFWVGSNDALELDLNCSYSFDVERGTKTAFSFVPETTGLYNYTINSDLLITLDLMKEDHTVIFNEMEEKETTLCLMMMAGEKYLLHITYGGNDSSAAAVWISLNRTAESLQYSNDAVGYLDDVEFGVSGLRRVYEFVPPVTSRYTTSSIEEGVDSYGKLYDANWNLLAEDDDSAGGFRYMIEHLLEKDETYYLEVGCYGQSTGQFSFQIQPIIYGFDMIGLERNIGNYLISPGEYLYFYLSSEDASYYQLYSDSEYDTYIERMLDETTVAMRAENDPEKDDDSGPGNNFSLNTYIDGYGALFRVHYYDSTVEGQMKVIAVNMSRISVLTNPDFKVPKRLKTISTEAFAGIAAKSIMIQNGITNLETGVFADCLNIQQIYIPSTVTSISDGFLDGCPLVNGEGDRLEIYGVHGSAAEIFAEYNQIPFCEVK